MKKADQISKEELIKRAKDAGFFKKESVVKMYGRTNGHFYYSKPPTFIDEYKTHKITRSDVGASEVKKVKKEDEVEYPLNQKDTVALIKGLENQEGVQELIDSGKLLKDDARKGVQKALSNLVKKED